MIVGLIFWSCVDMKHFEIDNMTEELLFLTSHGCLRSRTSVEYQQMTIMKL